MDHPTVRDRQSSDSPIRFLFVVTQYVTRRAFHLGQHKYLIEIEEKRADEATPRIIFEKANEYSLLTLYKEAMATNRTAQFPSFAEAFPCFESLPDAAKEAMAEDGE